MQIHPHFLFNTLNAIAGLMREDVESADVMLAQLSELLRGTLQTEGVQEVPLTEELRLLRAYLAIQQTLFGDRLRIEIDVADDCGQNLVPTLIPDGFTPSSTRSAPTGRSSASWSRRPPASTRCGPTMWNRWRPQGTTSSCAPRPAPISCATRWPPSSAGSTARDSCASIGRRS
jgi:hypothetical protein